MALVMWFLCYIVLMYKCVVIVECLCMLSVKSILLAIFFYLVVCSSNEYWKPTHSNFPEILNYFLTVYKQSFLSFKIRDYMVVFIFL